MSGEEYIPHSSSYSDSSAEITPLRSKPLNMLIVEDCSELLPEIQKIRDSTEIVLVEGSVSKGADTTEKQVKTCLQLAIQKIIVSSVTNHSQNWPDT